MSRLLLWFAPFIRKWVLYGYIVLCCCVEHAINLVYPGIWPFLGHIFLHTHTHFLHRRKNKKKRGTKNGLPGISTTVRRKVSSSSKNTHNVYGSHFFMWHQKMRIKKLTKKSKWRMKVLFGRHKRSFQMKREISKSEGDLIEANGPSQRKSKGNNRLQSLYCNVWLWCSLRQVCVLVMKVA